MAHETIEEADGGLIRVRISDVFRLADQEALQVLAKERIDKYGKVRVLAIIDHFQGWGHGEDWNDVGFLLEYGDDIEKIALVGDERIKDQAFLFVGKGFRATEVEFFPQASLEEAERWVLA